MVAMAFPVLGLVISALSTVVPLGCHLDSVLQYRQQQPHSPKHEAKMDVVPEAGGCSNWGAAWVRIPQTSHFCTHGAATTEFAACFQCLAMASLARHHVFKRPWPGNRSEDRCSRDKAAF